jgi:hypothetical protein
VNFAIADPPLKLVLLENPGSGGTLNHLGVEVASVDEVDAERTRLGALGLASTEERDSTCCYAKQTKFWVENTPGGERWEVYTVLADSSTFSGDAVPAATEPAGDTAAEPVRRAPAASTEVTEPAAGGSSRSTGPAAPAACC